MHELSIAQNIVETVNQYVPNVRNNSVKSVRLRIGELSGVVADSLEFCFSAITADTPLSGTTLEIERIPYTLHCLPCDKVFTSELGVVLCPACGGNNTRVVDGIEMRVVEIELNDGELKEH